VSLRAVWVTLAVLSSSARAAPPRDFTAEIRALYAVAACGDPAPSAFPAALVKQHCAEVTKDIKQWQTKWLAIAQPWIAKLLAGQTLPTTIVYPFGGGDLITMLAVYPDGSEYTTLSLEGMGDPRPLADLAKKRDKLATQLGDLRKVVGQNLGWAWNQTIELSKQSSDTGIGVPQILAFALIALVAHGYEPLEVRYFTLAADGSVVYVTQEQVDAFDTEHAKDKGKSKKPKEVQQGLFNNIEITFRKKGDAAAPKRTFRHIAADLSDDPLAKDGSALAYIDRRKDFASVTKAASYLFWRPGFDKMRATFVARMKLMVSDDTGIPPRWAKPAGFKQDVYGVYLGSFFKFPPQDIAKEMVELWKDSTTKLPFRFGYYDNRRNPHLMYTHK
jgi:hypothetical protein